jgi:hypothetical protein
MRPLGSFQARKGAFVNPVQFSGAIGGYVKTVLLIAVSVLGLTTPSPKEIFA